MSVVKVYDETIGWMFKHSFWEQFGTTIIRIALIIIVGRAIVWFIHRSINKIMLDKLSSRHPTQKRRITTIGKLLKNVTSYVTYFIIGLLTLSELGVAMGPLLAGAGIVGIAIGFGAQSLVKDILTGLFIVLEDQFAVGDTVSTGKFKGKVEMIGLRTTRLINEKGELHIVPNNLINEVTNYSINSSHIVIDIPIEYHNNLQYIMNTVKECVSRLEHVHLLSTPTVLGLQQFDKNEIVMRIEAECTATFDEVVQRYMNEQLKIMLEQNGLQLNEGGKET